MAAQERHPIDIGELCESRWGGEVVACRDTLSRVCHIACRPEKLAAVCEWLDQELGYAFATLIVEESRGMAWSLTYVFYGKADSPWIYVEIALDAHATSAPSISHLAQGPAVDWHEREIEDLFGLAFEGHPRLGEFVLHENWPEGANPMRRDFNPRRVEGQELDQKWLPPTVVVAPGAFAMPVGPVFSDFAEAAHFLLETVGEDVIRTVPRLSYKYRGVEKIAEGQSPERALLLAERFSGTSAFAHGLAFCQALEAIREIDVPSRALALRTVFAELERLRHHAATVTGICNSTALAVAASQSALIEENLLRLSCEVAGHRYMFGLVAPGGIARDFSKQTLGHLAAAAAAETESLRELYRMLRYSSSYLDRLEQVGIVSPENARSYGLFGPIARASGIGRDIRKLRPYAAYQSVDFDVPVEEEGDGYARLRVLFREAEQSTSIIRQLLFALPDGPTRVDAEERRAGAALSAVEAPIGAAFHWLRLDDDGAIARYRITPPSFANWHGFHLAAENFAFQDFPIILASFSLSNAECDR